MLDDVTVAGLSKSVIENRNALILSQIESHAPNKEKYSLIAKVVNVGVALLVYGRDDGVARRVCDVQTQWTGCGPAYLGNKGAVGVRFRAAGKDGGVGEVYTYVTCLFVHVHCIIVRDNMQQVRVRTPHCTWVQPAPPYSGLPPNRWYPPIPNIVRHGGK